jgi:hypothetical protein
MGDVIVYKQAGPYAAAALPTGAIIALLGAGAGDCNGKGKIRSV